MKRKILVDVGSSTVKVYKWENKELKLLFAKTIHFKNGFTSSAGISKTSKNKLFSLIQKIRSDHPGISVQIYATAVFRKMEKSVLIKFKIDFFKNTGVKFRVISQELENECLRFALIGKYQGKKKIMLVNIGGGSTEIVIIKNKIVVDRKNIDFGVSNILSKFSGINKNISDVSANEVIKFVSTFFPKIEKTAIAFYSGGELTYMRLSGYKLEKNLLFKDASHPFYISIENFRKRNKDIFKKITIKKLQKLMPQNPEWMLGARACSVLSESIFIKYGVKTIIPSDVNLIDGLVARDLVNTKD